MYFTDGYLPIAAPSMWTRKDFKEFKDSLRKDPDSIIKVGSGETVTVSNLNWVSLSRRLLLGVFLTFCFICEALLFCFCSELA